MARRRQRRRREKERRHAPRPVTPPAAPDGNVDGPLERLVYSREQAAQALGISLATLDRRVIPAIATIKTEWGARLIRAAELDRYLAECTEEPRMARRRPARSGRKSRLPIEVVTRIRRERAQGSSLADIADRLNRDGIPTGQGGRQWWPSTVRSVLVRARPPITTQNGSASARGITGSTQRSSQSRQQDEDGTVRPHP
jgi:Recombinase